MADDYFKAANRHFDSADVLHRHGRRVEASHLYAYACECALKAILGVQNSPPESKSHINDHRRPSKRPAANRDLVSFYQSKQQGRSGLPLANTAIFTGWTIDERYGDGANVQPHLDSHFADANDVRRVFRNAIQAGVLP